MNTNEAKDYIKPVKNQMSQTLEDVQNRVTDTANRLTGTAKNVSKATDRYVRDNPWQTIAVVAVAACLVGWFISSSRD